MVSHPRVSLTLCKDVATLGDAIRVHVVVADVPAVRVQVAISRATDGTNNDTWLYCHAEARGLSEIPVDLPTAALDPGAHLVVANVDLATGDTLAWWQTNATATVTLTWTDEDRRRLLIEREQAATILRRMGALV